MNKYTKLPGTPKPRRRPPLDTEWTPRTIEQPELQAAVLDLLAAGPLPKRVIRETLHVQEHHLGKAIDALKAAKEIKMVGHRQVKLMWALRSYVEPPMVHARPFEDVASARKAKQAPTTSWWLEAPRDRWTTVVDERWRRVQSGTVAQP